MSGPFSDRRGVAAAFVLSLALYVVSMSPVVYWGDSAELSARALTLDLSPIARGYPLLSALTWTLGKVLQDTALAANAVSALFGATSVALTYALGVRLGNSRVAGVAAAATLGVAHSFWWFAGIAEVYTLHTSILALLFLLTVGAASAGPGRRWMLGLVAGLSFLHHRMSAFALPAVAVAFVLDVRRSRPAGERLRPALEALGGLLLGLLPFLLLCATSSRSPPPGTTDPVLWWLRDVFGGGESNTDLIFGAGRKTLPQNVAYVARWIAFNLPGPALVLAGTGMADLWRRRDSVAWLFALLLPLHLVFPLRYDWTGDQFSFLVPFYACVAPVAGLGAARLLANGSPRLAWSLTAAAALLPPALYVSLATTPLGAAAFPRLDEKSRREVALPVRAGRHEPYEWTSRVLDRLPRGAVLHSEWGEGQVVRYLQAAEGRRTDVDARIWFDHVRLVPADADHWATIAPGTYGIPRALLGVADRLEEHGDGLVRILPEGERR